MAAGSNTALVVRVANGHPTFSKESIPIPRPEPNQVLVKISHVAQNPTDVQSFDNNAFGDGALLGCDFVGEVVELGSKVTRYALGDIIAGLIWGGEIKYLGAYGEYCVADELISFKVPSGISPAQASTVPLAVATAWLTWFSKDCLGLDKEQGNGASVLVWGGSSSVGLYAIQLASIYGFDVVTTCSTKHTDLVRSHGANHVFDYKDPHVVEKIRQAAPDLGYIFDTIGNRKSSALASQALRATGGKLCTVRPGKANTEDVTERASVSDVLVWTAFLKDHSYGDFRWPASQDDHGLSSELFEKLPGWLAEGTVKSNTPKVLRGLDSIPEGFQHYRDGKISAYKVVYEL
ncbi:putative zinc-binding dehydrogenase family oxidoreductase [Aspergillus pseudoustus]|uniref:Zinc-binding dehydrogenase family oxidoreductase n=1 Tax=Aspergillus pseudoustus TaxID=1810923 RepID=A0ABR4JRA6_9EURO